MPTGNHGLVTKDGELIRKGRISPAVRTAVTLVVLEGLSIRDAAQRVKLRPESLEKALRKPHVKALKSDVMRAWRESKTERAWLTVADLAESGSSEDVRLKAARFMIEQDEAARAAMPAQARQVVQIITNTVQMGAQLPDGQMSGVIEAEAYQPLLPNPSNSDPVGRPDDDDE